MRCFDGGGGRRRVAAVHHRQPRLPRHGRAARGADRPRRAGDPLRAPAAGPRAARQRRPRPRRPARVENGRFARRRCTGPTTSATAACSARARTLRARTALDTLAALRLLDDATFSLAEDAGGDGERVIRLRGELDIESAPDLERVLLRPRARPPARGARPRRSSSSWTRPDCACSCAHERPPRRAAGSSACATCRRPSAACST